MPKVKNITKNSNIIIKGKILLPGKSMAINEEDLDALEKLIENGALSIGNIEADNIVKNNSNTRNIEEIKKRMIQAFFSLHLNQNLSLQQLQDLKWFYMNVGPTSMIDKRILELLNDVTNGEEFVEILLNHIYPELIKNHL
jgi:hypothetical protein